MSTVYTSTTNGKGRENGQRSVDDGESPLKASTTELGRGSPQMVRSLQNSKGGVL